MRHRIGASKDDVAVAVSRRRRAEQQPPTPIVQINANAEVASFRGADLGLALNELDFPRAFESPPDSTNDSRAIASACLDRNNASGGFLGSPDDRSGRRHRSRQHWLGGECWSTLSRAAA